MLQSSISLARLFYEDHPKRWSFFTSRGLDRFIDLPPEILYDRLAYLDNITPLFPLPEGGVKRILVILGEHLLSAGLESLLAGENNLTVMSTVASRENSFREIIEQNCPQVVIMDNYSHFASFSQIMSFLADYPELRILVVNERENAIHVYDKVRITVTHRADLMNAVHGIYRPAQ